MATKMEKRFGRIAVEKGFITLQQLIEAMNIQIMEEIECGRHRLIGAILYQKRYITDEQIDEVLRALGRRDN